MLRWLPPEAVAASVPAAQGPPPLGPINKFLLMKQTVKLLH